MQSTDRSLSINKSDNCQCRQLFVTALLSWLSASCHSHRGKSEFYILWLPSAERRHLHMNQLSTSLYSDNSVTAQKHQHSCCCAHFSEASKVGADILPNHVILWIWNIKVLSIMKTEVEKSSELWTEGKQESRWNILFLYISSFNSYLKVSLSDYDCASCCSR